MSGECDECGEHTLECSCKLKFSTAALSNAYWGYIDNDFTFNTLLEEHKDALIRDIIKSSAIQLNPEQLKEAEEESLWFEVTDDGLRMSKGLVEFMQDKAKELGIE